MQVNRLSQLPSSSVTPSVTPGSPDAAGTQTQGSPTVESALRAPHNSAALPQPESTHQPAPQPSVKLDLDSSQHARAPLTYGPDSLFAGKSSIEVAHTPAERFVAQAVDIMRAYEQQNARPSAQGPIDRIKQAMSRFSAQV